MKKLIKPFETIHPTKNKLIVFGWVLLLFVFWGFYGTTETHMFPTISQVIDGFIGLWNEGLVTHIGRSLWLCGRAVMLSVAISLTLVYLSPIPLLRPLGAFISRFRYLPLTGIAFYITMLISSARTVQIWILVVFMTTYLVTSLLSMLKDIKEEEFDHARTLGCNRWEVLLEVIIKGRFDYVIESVRQNFAMIWFALVTVESIMAAAGGIGFLIKNSDKFMNHGRIIALQLVILFIGIGLDWLLTFIRRITFRYSKF